MTTPASVHREFVVDPGCARRMALAALRYRVTRPSFLVVAGLVVAVGIVSVAFGAWFEAALMALVLIVLLGTSLLQVRVLAKALAARGYRPGDTVSVDYYAESFVVTTPLAHATHHFRDVSRIAVTATTVAIHMRESRMLVLLPAELVADEVRTTLSQLSAHANRRHAP